MKFHSLLLAVFVILANSADANRFVFDPKVEGREIHRVECGNDDGVYETCEVGGLTIMEVQIEEEYSDDDCSRDLTYGVDGTSIWASSGCSAKFKVLINRKERLECGAEDGKFNLCSFGAHPIRIESVRERSNNKCMPEQNLFIYPSSVSVSNGCRMEFKVSAIESGSLTCESRSFLEKRCRIPNARFVDQVWIEEQLSQGLRSCEKNESWGFAKRGVIWVKDGCQARFRYIRTR